MRRRPVRTAVVIGKFCNSTVFVLFLVFFFPFYYAVFGIVLAFKKCRISIRFYHLAVNKGKKKKDDIGNNYYVIDEKEKSKYFFMFGYFVNTRNSFRVTNVRS